MRMDIYIAVIFTFLVRVCPVLGDYEHTCTFSDYFGVRVMGRGNNGATVRCGNALMNMVDMLCGGQMFLGQSFISIKKKRSITLSDNDANSYLTGRSRGLLPVRSGSGIVCECCTNTCSISELRQYCLIDSRKRRSLRDVITGGQVQEESKLTDEDALVMYKLINKGLIGGDNVMTPELADEMRRLEHNKQVNIERKQRLLNKADVSLGSDDDSSEFAETNTSLKGDNPSESQLIANSLTDSRANQQHRHRHSRRRHHRQQQHADSRR